MGDAHDHLRTEVCWHRRPLVSCLKDAHELRLASRHCRRHGNGAGRGIACRHVMAARFDPRAIDAVLTVPLHLGGVCAASFDHMELVSRALCREKVFPQADLVRPHSRDQHRGALKEERAASRAPSQCVMTFRALTCCCLMT